MAPLVRVNQGVHHIINNLNIFGFGSENSAIIQSVKEMLENSIDACKVNNTGNDVGEVSIAISTVSNSPSLLMIDVMDDGTGMQDPKKFLGCFESSKGEDSTSLSTGRFGVGLSTCLIYSLSRTTLPMRIFTKTKENTEVTVADYKLDTRGEPTVIQSRTVDSGFVCGTKIKLCVPLEDRSQLVGVVAAIDTVLSQFHLLPTTYIKTTFTVDVGPIQHKSVYDAWLPSIARYITTSPAMYRDKLTQRLDATSAELSAGDSSSDSESTNNSRSSVGVSHYSRGMLLSGGQCFESVVQVVDEGAFKVVVSINVMQGSAPNVDEDDGDYSDGDSGGSHVQDSGTMSLRLLRYANSVPLLDYRDDAMSCVLSSALKSIPWVNYGHKLKLNLEDTAAGKKKPVASSTAGEMSGASGNYGVSSQDTIVQPPRWQLESIYKDEERHLFSSHSSHTGSTGSGYTDTDGFPQFHVVVTVDVQSSSIPFGNMRKTCLGGESRDLQLLITQGLKRCLGELQASERTADMFMGKRQYRKNKIASTYIPSVAASVAKIISMSKNVEFQDYCLECVGLEATAQCSQELLQQTIEQCIQNMYITHNATPKSNRKRQKKVDDEVAVEDDD